MSMKKILASSFLGIALLAVAVFGIAVSPQSAYAVGACSGSDGCTYERLSTSFLQDLLPILDGNETYLRGMNLDAANAASIQGTIDRARTSIRDVIAARPAVAADEPTKSAWATLGTQAVREAEAVRDNLQTLQRRAAPSQQANLGAERALCATGSPDCNQARITALEATIRDSVAVATGKPRDVCVGIGGLFDPGCWLRIIAVVIGTLLISISAWILAIADLLFNWTVDNTILLFATSVFDKVKDGVDAGWTAMRDIANIVIIGMFTFIAISTILGIQEYAAKKMLTRVLVIAVLINFSLLFTKMIIDASNFTAGQFYASMSGAGSISAARADAGERAGAVLSTGATPVSTGIGSFRERGIAGAFIGFLKVTSIGDTYDALAVRAKSGWWVALAHGLLATTLLGGAAAVLFYGTYLLISRAVLFIFLMVTAAGAFATHLIPKLNESTYGWKGWWSSLLRNAALAPLLMIFLWITLQVSAAISASGGTLGGLANPAVTTTDVGALFAYFIILGLLWGSFMLASKWAGKVGGLGLTGTLLGSAIAAPLALGSRFIAAPLMRKFVGGAATRRSLQLEDDIKDARDVVRMAPKGSLEHKDAMNALVAKMKAKERADMLAKGSFNLPNTKLAQMGIKALGMPSFLTGVQKKPKGYADIAEERAKKEIAQAEKLVVTKGDAENELLKKRRETDVYKRQVANLRAFQSVMEQVERNQEDMLPTLTERLERAERNRDGKKQVLDTAVQQRGRDPVLVNLTPQYNEANAALNREEGEKTRIERTSKSEIDRLDAIINSTKSDTERSNATSSKLQAVVKQDRDLKEQASKIEGARARVTELQQKIEQVKVPLDEAVRLAEAGVNNASGEVDGVKTEIRTLNTAYQDAKKAYDNLEGKMREDVKKISGEAQEIADATSQVATDVVARKVYRRLTNFGPRVFGINVEEGGQPDSDTMTEYARNLAKKTIKKLPMKQQLQMLRELDKDELGGRDTSAPGPASPGPASAAAPKQAT